MAIVIGRSYTGQAVAIEVDARPIEIDAVNNAEVAIGGAAVRVRYAVDEEQARRIDQAAIRRSFLEAGAVRVVFRPTVERKVRARVDAMNESLDQTEAFALWLASQNGKINVDPEALRALHAEMLERAR